MKMKTELISIFMALLAFCNLAVIVAVEGDCSLLRPLGTDIPDETIFKQSTEHLTFTPPKYLADGILNKRAIPTNCWWGNLISNTKEKKIDPVWSKPYVVKPEVVKAPFGFQITYPFTHRSFGGSSGNSDAAEFYIHASVRDLTVTASELSKDLHYEVYDWDDFSVMHRFMTAKDSKQKIESTLVSGNAFVTSKYFGLSPVIHAGHAIEQINGKAKQQSITGSKFTLALNNGQNWVIFTDNPITFTVEGNDLVSSKPFNGHIRVALTPQSDSLGESYEQFATCIVTGADLSIKDSMSYDINWQTTGDCKNGLLHYGLLHHLETLQNSTASLVKGLTHQSATHGPMEAYKTKAGEHKWSLAENKKQNIRFTPPTKASSKHVADYNIKKSLEDDISSEWVIKKDGSHYFNGKAAQKYASLCLMANEESITGSSRNDLLSKCLVKLEKIMEFFIKNTWKYPLVYDKVYRGIVSSEGFVKKDMNADFGNTIYNDHHFHYGYWITAAAIVRHLHPKWNQIENLSRITNDLLRDVVNPSDEDVHFAKFRNFDWFNGNSYSHGVTPFGDGKDQESSSEDINFHYGVMLWGKASGNKNLESLGELMVKLNSRAIQTYFLMDNNNKAHPKKFIKNKVTGIYFDNKAHYGTWFSKEKYAIHGIQMIPISPITEIVRLKKFIKEEWDEVLSKEKVIKDNDKNVAWASLLLANYATVDKEYALRKLQDVKMDDGLTKSWALYMAATRP